MVKYMLKTKQVFPPYVKGREYFVIFITGRDSVAEYCSDDIFLTDNGHSIARANRAKAVFEYELEDVENN